MFPFVRRAGRVEGKRFTYESRPTWWVEFAEIAQFAGNAFGKRPPGRQEPCRQNEACNDVYVVEIA
jgi:hypothetical protein